jgi:plasmid maintenance system antidote protein VapI
MSLRIGKFCGNGPQVWIRMQAAYDLWRAEQRVGAQIAAIKTQRAA